MSESASGRSTDSQRSPSSRFYYVVRPGGQPNEDFAEKMRNLEKAGLFPRLPDRLPQRARAKLTGRSVFDRIARKWESVGQRFPYRSF